MVIQGTAVLQGTIVFQGTAVLQATSIPGYCISCIGWPDTVDMHDSNSL